MIIFPTLVRKYPVLYQAQLRHTISRTQELLTSQPRPQAAAGNMAAHLQFCQGRFPPAEGETRRAGGTFPRLRASLLPAHPQWHAVSCLSLPTRYAEKDGVLKAHVERRREFLILSLPLLGVSPRRGRFSSETLRCGSPYLWPSRTWDRDQSSHMGEFLRAH